MPLLLIMGLSLLIGQSFVARSQRDVLSYATEVSRNSLLDETNQARTSNSLNELTIDTKLNKAAQAKADDMVSRNYWSHTTPDDEAPWVFVDEVNYSYQKVGENLAYGFVTSGETVRGWMQSTSHRQNILDSAYTEIGFGIASSPDYIGNGQQTVIVALYGRPASAIRLPASFSSLSFGVISPNEQPVNSSDRIISEPAVMSVSKVHASSIGTIPGISFILGLIAGAGLVFLIIRHSIKLKRLIKDGERFVVKHPVLDLTIVSFVVLVALLSQSVGYIR